MAMTRTRLRGPKRRWLRNPSQVERGLGLVLWTMLLFVLLKPF